MGTDPVSTASAAAKLFDMLKNIPLWLIAAAAIILTLFVSVPSFRDMVSPATLKWVSFGVAAAWVLTATLTVSTVAGWYGTFRTNRAPKFVITVEEAQSFWHIAKQTDGSFVTQFSIRFMVKNRMPGLLYLRKVKLVRPSMKGDELSAILTVEDPVSGMHGTAYASGSFVPAGETVPGSAHLMIRGTPKQQAGYMVAHFDVTDADENRTRFNAKLRCT